MIQQRRYFRKVIQITAEDSPCVARGLWLKERYPHLDEDEIERLSSVLPGVLGYKEYRKRRKLWDKERQAVGLDAIFYTGPELMLFPGDWLQLSAEYAAYVEQKVREGFRRVAKGLGVDPGEGSANTAWTVSDEYGIIEQIAYQTQDTTAINDQTIALGRQYNLSDDRWMYDYGGGGKQHADALRKKGYRGVRTVGFGEAVLLDPKRSMRMYSERVEIREARYTYFNRRAQMYGEASNLLDPSLYEDSTQPGPNGACTGDQAPFSKNAGRMRIEEPQGFGIPRRLVELRRQLSKVPKRYDEGRLRLPPKNSKNEDSDEVTLTKLIGHSPDEADSFVVSVHTMLHRPARSAATAGA